MTPPLARVVHVDVVEATLRCAWPRTGSATLLRGAVCGELERLLVGSVTDGHRIHVDWHNHAGEAGTMTRVPRVQYRIGDDGLPRVYLWGDLATEHVALLSRLRALRFDRSGTVIDIDQIDVVTRRDRACVTGRTPFRYRLQSPLFPPKVAVERRPAAADQGAARAWASFTAAAGIRPLLTELGVDLDGAHVCDTYVDGVCFVDVQWRGGRERTVGILGDVYTNAEIPDGMAIGARRAEGFGVLRRV